MHGKQTIQTALTSNPLVAAIALKAGGLGGFEGMSIPSLDGLLSSDILFKEVLKSTFLGELGPLKLLEEFLSPADEESKLKKVEAVSPIPDFSEKAAPDWTSALIADLLSPGDNENSVSKKRMTELQELVSTILNYYDQRQPMIDSSNVRSSQ